MVWHGGGIWQHLNDQDVTIWYKIWWEISAGFVGKLRWPVGLQLFVGQGHYIWWRQDMYENSYCQTQPQSQLQLKWAEIAVGIHHTYTLPTPTQNSSLNLSVTCSYFAHNLFVTFSWLVHYLMFVTCSWFANYLFMTCSLRFHDLFTISSLLIHNFFITCSIFFLQLIQDFYATLTQFLLLYDLFGTCSFKYYFFMTYS